MALINCPECGKEISEHARSCPACGFPLTPGDAVREITAIGKQIVMGFMVMGVLGFIAGIYLKNPVVVVMSIICAVGAYIKLMSMKEKKG